MGFPVVRRLTKLNSTNYVSDTSVKLNANRGIGTRCKTVFIRFKFFKDRGEPIECKFYIYELEVFKRVIIYPIMLSCLSRE